MARQPRLIVPEVAMHIVQRGVDRTDCFRDDTDRLVHLTLLREWAATTRCALHAFCLMTNHVHLLVTPADLDGPARLMSRLGQRYVPYFNRRYGRTGTLWEGRFKSCLVDSAEHVLACYRYIELNPVRAGMACGASAYAWSSHRGNAGTAPNRLLTPHPEYESLGSDPASRHAAYRGLFETDIPDTAVRAIRAATLGGYPLASEELKARLVLSAQRRLEPGKPGRKSGAAPESDPITRDLGL